METRLDGFDDVGSMVAFLVERKHWKERDGEITAPELKVEATPEKLIRLIEERGLEKEVKLAVADVWRRIEEGCAVERKNRYNA